MIDIPGVKIIKKEPIYKTDNGVGFFIASVWVVATVSGIFISICANAFPPIALGVISAIILGAYGSIVSLVKPKPTFKHTQYTLEISDEANFNQVNSYFKSLWSDKDIWYAIPREEE